MVRWMIDNDVGINSECIKSTIKIASNSGPPLSEEIRPKGGPEWDEIIDLLHDKDV